MQEYIYGTNKNKIRNILTASNKFTCYLFIIKCKQSTLCERYALICVIAYFAYSYANYACI